MQLLEDAVEFSFCIGSSYLWWQHFCSQRRWRSWFLYLPLKAQIAEQGVTEQLKLQCIIDSPMGNKTSSSYNALIFISNRHCLRHWSLLWVSYLRTLYAKSWFGIIRLHHLLHPSLETVLGAAHNAVSLTGSKCLAKLWFNAIRYAEK